MKLLFTVPVVAFLLIPSLSYSQTSSLNAANYAQANALAEYSVAQQWGAAAHSKLNEVEGRLQSLGNTLDSMIAILSDPQKIRCFDANTYIEAVNRFEWRSRLVKVIYHLKKAELNSQLNKMIEGYNKIQNGNEAMFQGHYDQALALYDEAQIIFNTAKVECSEIEMTASALAERLTAYAENLQPLATQLQQLSV